MKNLKNILAIKDQNLVSNALIYEKDNEITLKKVIPKTSKDKKKHVTIKTKNSA